LIVDYVGIFRNRQKALAIYGTTVGGTGESPIRGKVELFHQLLSAIAELTTFSEERETSRPLAMNEHATVVNGRPMPVSPRAAQMWHAH